jgi:hypothetical protein
MVASEIHTLAKPIPDAPHSRRKRGRARKNASRKPNGRLRWQPEDPITPERRQHGLVRLAEEQIADDDGRPSHPYVAFTELMLLERDGAISAEMRQAGEDFQKAFNRARHAALRASDVSRPFVSGRTADTLSALIVFRRARDQVWHAMLAVGGAKSVPGSCIWFVLGQGHPLKAWAADRVWALAVLVRALSDLEAYYRGEQRRHRRARPGGVR